MNKSEQTKQGLKKALRVELRKKPALYAMVTAKIKEGR